MATIHDTQEPVKLPVTLDMIYAQVQGLAAHVELSKINRERIEALERRTDALETRMTHVEENQTASAATAKSLSDTSRNLADAALRLQMASVLSKVAPTAIQLALIMTTSFVGGVLGQLVLKSLHH